MRLIQADLGAIGIIGPVVDLQHVLHSRHELAIGFAGETPLLLQVWLEVPLWSTLRTVSCETRPPWPSSPIRLAKSRSAQRLRPSGAWLQARAIRYACCSASSF